MRRDNALILATTVLAAALLRLSPASEVYTRDGGVRLVSADCEHHLGRVERVLAGLPLQVHDPDLNFPAGGIAIWPPLFDQAAAGFVAILRQASPDATTRGLAALFPVLLGSLLPLATYALARSLLAPRWSLAAAAWAAGAPAYLLYSDVGHLDQHVAEGLLATTAAALLAQALARDAGSRAALWRLALSGLAAGTLVMTWQGGVYLAPVLAAGLALGRRFDRGGLPPWEVHALLAPCACVAAAGTALTLAGEAPVPFTYVSISWFQPAFLALTWMGLSLAALPSALRSRRSLALVGLGLVPGVATLAAAGALGLLPRFLGGLAYLRGGSTGTPAMELGGFIEYPKAWLSVVGESRPLGAWPAIVTNAPRLLTWPALVAVALALVIWAAWPPRGRRLAPARAFLVVTLAHAIMSLSQQRYTYLLAAESGIAVVVVTRRLVLAWLLRSRRAHGANGSRTARSVAHAGPVLAAALLLSAAPAWKALPGTVQGPAGDAADFLTRIRTTVGAPPRDATGVAAWGAMVPWALGHPFREWTGIPVSADNFGYGFEAQARLYLARSDDEAMAILAAHRDRYVLTTRLEHELPRYAALLGLPPPDDRAFGLRLHRGEVSPALLRPVVDSRSGDDIGGRFVPRTRLFEVQINRRDSR